MQGSPFWTKCLLLTVLLLSQNCFSATGPETAQLLNQRYQKTLNECPGANPAYFCSGVFLRGSSPATQFWKHGAIATQLGAESFVYVRADLGTRELAHANGVVFSDSFTAIGQNKSLEVLCAYPFELRLEASRPAYGCGALASKQGASSCAAAGVNDAEGWLSHFHQQGQQPARQCSLSSQDAALFRASLLAHQGIDKDWSAKPNQIQIKNWDDNAPKQLPIQGLFYDLRQTGALLGAQKDQRDYFTATGEWLPIFRMDLHQAMSAVFGFNLQDQLYFGYQVAARLNARYADTAMACRDGSAAYNCNGVLIRVTDASPAFHAWNPSPGSILRNGVAFSYVREDLGTKGFLSAKTQGLIMKEMASPTGFPLAVRCAYPFDGATVHRSDSCNEYLNTPVSRPCTEQGIVSVATWRPYFVKLNDAFGRHHCSFNANQNEFAMSLDVRSHLPNPDLRRLHNEVVIAAWPQDIVQQLPLEAFFYIGESSLPNARFFQRDYFQQTTRFLPIMRVDLTTNDGQPFTFFAQDQSVQDSPTPELPLASPTSSKVR